MAKSWFSAKARSARLADITIYSDIGAWGITAQDFHDALVALGSPREIQVSISSDGGEVFTGFAVYNMLRNHPATKVVTVQGIAASMASVIAMAGDEIQMAENAMIMIHNPEGSVVGGVDQIASFSEGLAKIRESIANAYAARSGMKRREVFAAMDRESWFDARTAVKNGFADRVIGPVKMAARVNLAKFHNVPAAFGRTLKEMNTMATKGKAAAGRDDDNEDGEDNEAAVKSPAEIRAELLASQKEIRAVCKLAGKADAAEAYINADKSVPEVIADLESKREAEAVKAAEAAAKGKGKGKGKADGGTGGVAPGEVSTQHRAGEEALATLDTEDVYKRWNAAGKK